MPHPPGSHPPLSLHEKLYAPLKIHAVLRTLSELGVDAGLLLAGSGLFLSLGHMFIFMSYRAAATAAVAPFYYLFAIWAVILGWLIFGTLPNGLATIGIALILFSGLTIALLDERRRRSALELEPVT